MARRTSTTTTGYTSGRTTSRTQVSTFTTNVSTSRRSTSQASSGGTPVYPVSDYSGMNSLVRDPPKSSARTGSIIINISSSHTSAPDITDCPPTRSIVGDSVTIVDGVENYRFTLATSSTDVKATARISPTANFATAKIGIRDNVSNGVKITLRDADGNSVVYVFDTSTSTHDGSKNGSDEVIVGVSGISSGTPSTYAARLLTAINATTEYNNSLTLNITAETVGALTSSALSHTDAFGRSNYIKLSQDTAGEVGNKGIGVTTNTQVFATPFSSGGGLNPGKLHGATLKFKDTAGTEYSATCSAGAQAAASFAFNAASVVDSEVQLQSTNGYKIRYIAVDDCDEKATGQSRWLSSTTVPAVYYNQGTSAATAAQNLAAAIRVGHGAEIAVSVSDATISLTQRVGGTAGNTTISCTTNFVNSIVNGGSYSTGTVGAFSGGSALAYTASTATAIGVGSVTTVNHLAHAIQDSIDQARQYGVTSTTRGAQSGTDLAVDAFSVSLGTNGYVDIVQSTGGSTGNVIIEGTLVKDGHATLGYSKAVITFNAVTNLATTDAYVFADSSYPPRFSSHTIRLGSVPGSTTAAATALTSAINASSLSTYMIAVASSSTVTLSSKIAGQPGDNFSVAFTDSGGNIAEHTLEIQGVANTKNNGLAAQNFSGGDSLGFSGGVNGVNATSSPQTTTTMATTLATAINAKANTRFSASVLTSTTNSSGATIGRVQVHRLVYGKDLSGDSYIVTSNTGTISFESPDNSVAPDSRARTGFIGGDEERSSRRENVSAGGSRGVYDLRNPATVDYINPKAPDIYGFGSVPLENNADNLNNILLNRNGPYEYPSWKQIRNSDNKILKEHRAGNIMSIDPIDDKRFNAYDPHVWSMNPSSPPKFPGEFDHHVVYGEDPVASGPDGKPIITKYITDPIHLLPPIGLINTAPRFEKNTKYYYEPAAIIRHNPFVFSVTQVPQAGDAQPTNAKVRSTLFNGLHFFTNPEMNEIHKISDGAVITDSNKKQILRNDELYGFFRASINSILGSRDFIFKEQIFPKEINTFRAFTRLRENYEEEVGYSSNGMHRRASDIRSFWRKNKADRIRPFVDVVIDKDGNKKVTKPYSSLNQPYERPWFNPHYNGIEMSHGYYVKPDLEAMGVNLGGVNIQQGQAYYGAGIAIWTNPQSLLNAAGIDPNSIGAGYPHLYGVGFVPITCSIIYKGNFTWDSLQVDFDIDGDGDVDSDDSFLDPTPSTNIPGYLGHDFVGTGSNSTELDASKDSYNISQKMDHQPYDFSLLSMWPLDWPAHIATVERKHVINPNNIDETWTIAAQTWKPYGGQYSLGHVCLGLAPNRLGTPYEADGQSIDSDACNKNPLPGFGYCLDNWPDSVENFINGGQTVTKVVQNPGGASGYAMTTQATEIEVQLPPSFRTGAAGELIYSTKPTITFYKRRIPDSFPLFHTLYSSDNASDAGFDDPGYQLYMNTWNIHNTLNAERHSYHDTELGYKTSTASFQYLRHAWPYFQPLWRLDEISGRAPMHNSYLDFVEDITPMSRDYSILPEFRITPQLRSYDDLIRAYKIGNDDVFIKANHTGRVVRGTFEAVRPVANFLSLEGVRTKHSEVTVNLDPNDTFIINHISQSARTQDLPEDTDEIYHYVAADDDVQTNYSQKESALHWRNDSASVAFYERHGHAEGGENFAKILEQNKEGFSSDTQTSPAEVTLTFRAIKKLLPYKDFYPVNRTVTMGAQFVDIFSSSFKHDSNIYSASLLYTSSIDGTIITGAYPSDSTIAAAATQSFIEPFFAPGIMFNSIKSGIAVSYPQYKQAPKYFGNPNLFSQFSPLADSTTGGVDSNSLDGTDNFASGLGKTEGLFADTTDCGDGVTLQSWPYSHNGNAFVEMGYGSMMGVASAMPTFLMSAPSSRLSFETIYNLDIFFKKKFTNYMVDDFFDHDRAEIVEGKYSNGSDNDPHSWTTATGSATFMIVGGSSAGSETMTIHCAAHPFPMTISLTSADPENVDLVASGSTATINTSNYTASITYKHKAGPTERATEIMKAINKHCTASLAWNSGSTPAMDYFTSSMENKQILTASIEDGRLVKIRSAHSLNLQQQRLIHFTCSAGYLPITGSKVTITNASTGGGNGRFLGSNNRGIAKHQFKPHVRSNVDLDTLDSAERRIYESSINNFLAETINFFIAKQTNQAARYYDLRMPIMMSDAEKSSGTLTVQSGSTYYMSVNLYMGESHVMCEGPRFADVPHIRDNASSSMRGAFFGPPMEVVHRSTTLGGPSGSKDTPFWNSGAFGTGSSPFDSDITPNSGYVTEQQGLIDNITDPAYHHVTPPYFYGPSSVILKYKATGSSTTVQEVWSKSQQQSLYFEEYTTGLEPENLTGYTTNRFPTSSLCAKLPTPESVSTGSVYRMKIEDSVGVFNTVGGDVSLRSVAPIQSAFEAAEKSQIWVMMPKWISPVLDFGFSNTIAREVKRYHPNGDMKTEVKSNIKNVNPFYDNLTGRAMWLGYGFDPYSSEDKNIMKKRFETDEAIKSALGAHAGINAALETLEEAGLTTALRGIDPTQDIKALEKKGIWFQISEQFPEAFSAQVSSSISFATEFDSQSESGYATTRNDVFAPDEATGSLYNLLGFKKASGSDPAPIGKIATKKTISEAIVAIPYFEEPWSIEVANNLGADPQAYVGGYRSSDVVGEAGDENIQAIRTVAGTLKNAIIPGRYFLKTDSFIFENMLGLLLVDHLTTPGTPENTDLRGQYDDYQNSLSKVNNSDLGVLIKTLLGSAGSKTAVANLGYMMPPEFDFIHNAAVPSFQMAVAPFTHDLDRNDLMNIWQNLMPDVSYRANKVRSKITFRPNADPLGTLTEWTQHIGADVFGTGISSNIGQTHQGQFLSTWALNPESFNENWVMSGNVPKSSADFFKKLRWMVFKVKQRAAQDYEQYVERQIELKANKQGYTTIASSTNKTYSPLHSLKTREIYGSNWPYDHFSLLEKAKIDIEYKVGG